MTSAHAIVTGAALIAFSILLVNTVQPAHAQFTGGPYQLMHHTNPTANAGVFRLDTTSGEVSYCFVSSDSNLLCTHGVK